MHPRLQRLKNDYRDMTELKEANKDKIDIKVSDGYQKYTVVINGLKTFVGTNEDNVRLKDKHKFRIEIPEGYPAKPPRIIFEEPIFHPNVFASGMYCLDTGVWIPSKKLVDLVIDVLKVMTFEIVKPHDPANSAAKEWYEKNKDAIRNIVPKLSEFGIHKKESKIRIINIKFKKNGIVNDAGKRIKIISDRNVESIKG